MPNNMPGGRILSAMGSYINVISPYDGSMRRLDILTADLDKDLRLWRRAHSGTLGAIVSRMIAESWTVTGTTWWDIGNPPEMLMINGGWGCGLQLGMGSLQGQAMYNTDVKADGTNMQFWAFPAGMLAKLKVHVNSQGDESDGIVLADFIVQGNSLCFLLPDEAEAYDAYISQLQSLGQFTGLAAFAKMQQTQAL